MPFFPPPPFPSGYLQWDKRRRYFAACAPVGAICVFCLGFSDMWSDEPTPYQGFAYSPSPGFPPVVIFPLVLAMLVGGCILRFTNNDSLPKAHMALVGLAFVSTVAWLNVIGSEAVALLEVRPWRLCPAF